MRFSSVSELCQISPEIRGYHGDLRGHADAHRCCGNSLIGSVLVGFGVRQHAWRESLSKRARSTTPTSLHFRINGLRAVRNSVAQNPPSNPTVLRCDFYSAVYGRAKNNRRGNCVRPLNVPRSLTAFLGLEPRRHSSSAAPRLRGVTATRATAESIDGEGPFRELLISVSFDGGPTYGRRERAACA